MTGELIPFEFMLKGKLITAKDPSVIGQNYQSLKNLRYTEEYPEGIGGMSVVNSSAPTTGGTSYPRIKTAFHFRKEGEATDYEHLLVHAYRSTWQSPKIFRHSVDAPTTGEFTTTPLFALTDTTTKRDGAFSPAPNGSVAFCDGRDSLIWGGNEYQLGRFINFNTSGTINKDYTEALRNTLTDTKNRAILTKSSTMLFYIGATRPIKGYKCYFDSISTKNNSTATLVTKYWSGTAWAAVSSQVDGTSSGNKPLRVTGSVSFDSTVSVSKPRVIDGVYLHWYRVSSSGVASNSHMGHLTLDTPFQAIKDLWDGNLRDPLSFQLYNTTKYSEYVTNIMDDDYNESSSYTWVNIAGANYFTQAGFIERMAGIEVHIVGGSGNNNAATLTAQYSADGIAWTNVSGLIDGTSSGGKSMRGSGIVTWDAPTYNTEFQSRVGVVENPLYYYKFTWSATLSSPTSVYYIAGIPAPKEIRGYKYPLLAKNRLFLLNNEDGRKNSAICSGQDSPDVFNGDDTAELFFGDNSELTGGISLYSVLGSNIFDVTVFFKRSSIFGLTGGNPEDFSQFEIATPDGLVAPATLKAATIFVGDAPRTVALYQGAKGFYVFDNRVAIPISEDIKNFFNPRETTNTRKLHSSYIADSVGFVDEANAEYHWLFADASSTGKLNREYVYSLKYNKWYEIYRGSSGALQFGFSVTDTNSNKYNYGVLYSGKMTRLENGNHFAGNAVAHEFWTGDFAPDKGRIQKITSLRKAKLIAKSTTATSNSIVVKHYVDSRTSASSSFTLTPMKTGSRIVWGDNAKQSMSGTPNGSFHSLRFNLSTTNLSTGFTPLYLGGYFEKVREDL